MRRFPVLYLLHGDGRHERHGAGHLFQRGRVGQAATSLVRSGASRPMLIVMPESTDTSVVGDTEWANTSRGPVRVGRDRPRSICRLDLADRALPQRARHRRPLDGRLRRGQYRTAEPEPVLGGRELVGLLHADPDRPLRRRHTGCAAGQQPGRVRPHALVAVDRGPDPRPSLHQPHRPAARATGALRGRSGVARSSRSRRMCSAAPTTSLSGRITCRSRWASPPAGSRAEGVDDVRGADRPGAGAQRVARPGRAGICAST